MEQGTNAKTAAIIISAVCVVLYVVMSCSGIAPSSCGVTADSGIALRLVYPFVHGGVFHLLINVWVFLTIAFLYPFPLWRLLAAYFAAVLVPGACLSGVPTVGLSCAVYFLIGGVAVKARRRLRFVSWIMAYIVIGLLLPGVNALIHLYGFITGVAVTLLDTPFRWTR